jgi:acyl-CoA thioesterase
VGELSLDTAVDGSESRYRATLSADWMIWGLNGGYVASAALRAAATESQFTRPVSVSCHFLSGAKPGAVDLDAVPLRRAKRAESLRVTMTQEESPVLEALVWMVDAVEGLEHDHMRMRDVPAPSELPSTEALTDEPRSSRYSFFSNVEERPTEWIDDWEHREPGEPRIASWFRFRPVATFDDSIVDACRSLILMDTLEWPAAVRAYAGQVPWVAPSLDLSVRFHRFEPDSQWLLSDTSAAVATDGLIGGAASVWSESGRIVASGGEQMLCRPAPPAS